MLVILAIMFLSIILPAFFVKSEHPGNSHYVLAIDSGKPEHQQTLLNYLELLLKRDLLSTPKVAVVLLGKGLSILHNGTNQNMVRIRQLQKAGVEFFICGRSLRRHAERHPQIYELVSDFKLVENGTAHVNRLMDEGYINDFA